jgi:hypothetical protein
MPKLPILDQALPFDSIERLPRAEILSSDWGLCRLLQHPAGHGAPLRVGTPGRERQQVRQRQVAESLRQRVR